MKNGTQENLTFWSEAHLASLSVLPENEAEVLTSEALSCMPIWELWKHTAPAGLYGKTSPAFYPRTADMILYRSLQGWKNAGMGGRTGCLTLSISEYPNGRRRVFVVGHIDNRTDLAAKVLFEPESMCGNIATGSETQKETTAAIGKGVNYFRRGGNYKYHKDKKAATLRSSASSDCFDLVLTNEKETAETLLGWYGKHLWQNNQEAFSGDSFVVNGRQNPVISKNRAVTLDTDGRTNTVCYAENTGTQCHIRCLTPLECERLQGFPDNWTQIEWRGKPAEQCPDSPRYKAIGNSMAVPVMRWIGERIKRIKE